MRVDCEGCAGCCIDWRPIAPDAADLDHERRGGPVPLDDTYNLVSLTSDEIRGFLTSGFGDAMTPRLFAVEDATAGVAVDGHDLAAVGGHPAFVVGLRKVTKPVEPFGTEPAWLSSCVFLDPRTLQCRIHDDERYPKTCGTYPRDNLALDVETECERVEAAFGGSRLLESDPEGADPLSGLGALGATVFVHPDTERITGIVDRVAAGRATAADRAEFVAVAAASSPGTLDIDGDRYEAARERILEADSWVGRSIADWERRASRSAPEPALGDRVERRRGAPPTPGWE